MDNSKYFDPKNFSTEGAWERLQKRLAALLRGEVPIADKPKPLIRNVLPVNQEEPVSMDELLRNYEGIKKDAPSI